MRVNDIPEIARLSTPEKILLVEALWDDISSDESIIAAPVSHKKEFGVRVKPSKVQDFTSLPYLTKMCERK